MKLLPKTEQEAITFVYNIINQGDSRYNNYESERILADFLIKEAILIEERTIPKIDISKEDSAKTNPGKVQWSQKKLASQLLKKEGWKESEIYYERRFLGLQPDIMAESKNKLIIVECCSCRVHKIIDFLSESDEVWILTLGQDQNEEFRYLKDKMQWFIFKKGKSWQEVFSSYQKQNLNKLKQVKSPIDNL